MSRTTAEQIIARLDGEVVLLPPNRQNWFIANLETMRAQPTMTKEMERAGAERGIAELVSCYGFSSAVADKPYAFQDGVAIIPVHGTLINRYSWSWSYCTGYNYIRAMMNAALADDDVTLIVFDVNSYGGEAAGCFELAEEIREARSRKSLLAVVDSAACSAGYAIASACTKMVVTKSGTTGSIGVIAMHVSISGALNQAGIVVTLIYAGERKADGNPYEDLPAEVKAEIKADIDERYGEFVELVVKNRGIDSQVVLDTQSRAYRAEEALALGLIDAVQSPTEAVASFLAEMGSDDPSETEDNEPMADAPAPAVTAAAPVAAVAPDPAALAAAANTARTAEKERVKSVMSCDEAKDKTALASHLALNTDLSLDDCKPILAAAQPEKKAAAPAAPAASAAGAFERRMDQEGGAGVGADADAAQTNEDGSPKVSRAAAAMAMAWGKPKASSQTH